MKKFWETVGGIWVWTCFIIGGIWIMWHTIDGIIWIVKAVKVINVLLVITK